MNNKWSKFCLMSIYMLAMVFTVASAAQAVNTPYNMFAKATLSDGTSFPTIADLTINVTDANDQTVTFSGGSDPDGVIAYDEASGLITISMANFGTQWANGDGFEIVVQDGTSGESATVSSAIDETLSPMQTFQNDSNLAIQLQAGLPTYAVTFQAGDNGTLDGEASQTVEEGKSATAVTAVPAEGYKFANWTGDVPAGQETENPLTIASVTAIMTITANFVEEVVSTTYTVTFQAGANGTLSGEASQTVEEGQSATAVEAVPDAGYVFDGWTGDYTGADNPLTIANVAADMTVTANFVEEVVSTTYTVTFQAGANGTLSGEASQTVEEGQSATAVEAVPDAGYVFDGWTGDYTGTDNPLTIPNVAADMTVTANFVEEVVSTTYTVTFQAGANGTLSGEDSQTVEEGQSATAVEAVPDAGYVFDGWTGDYTGADNPLTIANVAADMTVTANFVEESSCPAKAMLSVSSKDGLTVTFDLTGSVGDELTFNYGDSNSDSDGENTYAEAGTYEVTLTAHDTANDCSDEMTITVVVGETQKGDADADGSISIFDALMIARYDAELISAEDFGIAADKLVEMLDVDCNGEVSVFDALEIAKYDVGLIESFADCTAVK